VIRDGNFPMPSSPSPAPALRVLMLNRASARHTPGGDSVQMAETARALRSLGVDVRERLAGEVEEADWDVDIVHAFNIQTAGETAAMQDEALRRGLPFALSPVYWTPYINWFADSGTLSSFWRAVRAALGFRPAERLYSGWQQFRATGKPEWRLQRDLLIRSTVLLPNANAEFDVLRKDFRLPADSPPAIVVPNAIDDSLYQAPDPDLPWHFPFPRRGFVLQVGRISPEKNPLGLIESLAGVDIAIVLAGQPSTQHADYVMRCRAAAERRGDVHFLPWTPHADLVRLYRAAAAHVLPSWRETPGLVSLEAAAAGCPIVTTSIGSAREYFGDDAHYCDPWSPSSIRSAVEQATGGSVPEALRSRVLREFTWRRAAEETLRAYRLGLMRGPP
jgi:glycosyltransferase involved in cell wall biosynthesis